MLQKLLADQKPVSLPRASASRFFVQVMSLETSTHHLAVNPDAHLLFIEFNQEDAQYEVIEYEPGTLASSARPSLTRCIVNPQQLKYVRWHPESAFVYTETEDCLKTCGRAVCGEFYVLGMTDKHGAQRLKEHMHSVFSMVTP